MRSDTSRTRGCEEPLGKLGGDDAVALIFERQEGGWIDREGVSNQDNHSKEKDDHFKGALGHPVDDQDVAIFDRGEAAVEATIKPVDLFVLGAWTQIEAHCVGLRVRALRALIMAVAAITRANWRNIWPVMPGRNEAGRKTAVKTSVMPRTGPVSSPIALIAASLGVRPSSM